jgi:hypothetical protein
MGFWSKTRFTRIGSPVGFHSIPRKSKPAICSCSILVFAQFDLDYCNVHVYTFDMY